MASCGPYGAAQILLAHSGGQISTAPPAGQRAIVFAPHPDDETLGCGGTLIKKRQAGADVSVVFMTDGSSSHAHLIDPAELRAIRRREAVAACAALGISADNLVFLALPDGALAASHTVAQARVSRLLATIQPDEVYIPYRRDYHPDHTATNRVVRATLRGLPRPVKVYEYPIWFWYRWPWMRRVERTWRGRIAHVGDACQGLPSLLGDLRTLIYVGDVLSGKLAALKEHRSQVERHQGRPDWRILADIADGRFLALLLCDHERYFRYVVNGA